MSVVIVPPSAAGMQLLDFLSQRFPHIATPIWRTRIEHGEVRDAHSEARLTCQTICATGMRLRYRRAVEDEPTIPFLERIVFEDEHLIVADKPHYLPVAPVGRYVRETLLSRLVARTGCATLVPLHRIDQDTAGLVVFSKVPSERAAYQRLFAQRAVTKVYWAVAGRLAFFAEGERCERGGSRIVRLRLVRSEASFMQAQGVEGVANTETEMRPLRTYGANAVLYELRPKTGARHQLRAVMSHLGAPIRNDRIYPVLLPQLPVAEFAHTPPLQLLAKSLAFTDPITGAQRVFTSQRELIRA